MKLVQSWLPIVLTAAVLSTVAWMRTGQLSEPAEAKAYMASCREAAEELPYMLPGGWIGQDAPVPTVVDEILRPNVLVSRSYASLGGRSRLGFLFVQTQDVQNLLGHYPPACYPGQGWTNLGGTAGDWTIGDLDIDGTIYRMVPPGGDVAEPVYIYNFILRPDGHTGRDMDAVFAAGRTGESRFFGAGQVQVLFFGEMSEAEREEAFESVVIASKPAIEAVLSGYHAE